MTPLEFRRQVLEPGLAFVVACGGPRDSPEARQMLLTIAGKESSWTHWKQLEGGPAHGPFQFERPGGVRQVMTHSASRGLVQRACARLNVPFEEWAIWNALASDGNLAVAVARALLLTDPMRLPAVTESKIGHLYYLRNWRPRDWQNGGPHPEQWDPCWSSAAVALRAP